MRIKHFQGYGTVNATKVRKDTFFDVYGEEKTKLIIKVQGLHEWGLKVNCSYDAVRWLLPKFEKNLPNDYWNVEVTTEYGADIKVDNKYGYEQVCVYTFIY